MDFLQDWFAMKDASKTVDVNSKIRALAFLPGARPRIISGEENAVQLRRLDDHLMGEPIKSSAGVLSVATSNDGRWVVTGANDGFTIWDVGQREGDPVRLSVGGGRAIDISSDSKWVLTGSDARTADVWDIFTGKRRLGVKHEYNVIAVKFCPCGERIATATLFGSVRIYATCSGRKLLTIPITISSNVTIPSITLDWFAHRPQIFAVSQGHIKCINSDDGSLVFQWPIRGATHPSSIALSPNNKVIAYSINSKVILRDTTTREQIGDALKHDGNVSCIAFPTRNDQLVAGADTKISVWDLRKLLPSHLVDDSAIKPESCTHHKQDLAPKPPPSTFSLPLLSIINAAVKPWLHGFLEDAKQVLSTEIERSAPKPDHNTYANRALIQARMGNGDAALDDANESLHIQKSAIGWIAKAIAFICQKDYESAKQFIPKILDTCDSDEHGFLLKVIQSILLCLSGQHDNEISNIVMLDVVKKGRILLLLVQANMNLSVEDFDSAMDSFHKARVPVIFPHDETQEMWTISFAFGWKFSGLAIQIQQKKCEFLLNAGDSQAAILFVEMKNTYQREISTHIKLSDWSSKFREDCLQKLQGLGDEALKAGNYNEAIKQYTAVEPLIEDQDLKHQLLLNRSKAYAEIDPPNLQQALQDAEDAIKINSLSPWGYDRKHAAMYIWKCYSEAAKALDIMINTLAISKDSRSEELRGQGVDPIETRRTIIGVVEEILAQPRPHILINTESGRLCDKQKQAEAFRAHPRYKELVLSPTSQLEPKGAWKETIRCYFRYSTLSHTWEADGEPEFRDVECISVDNLPKTFNTKLQTFCSITHNHGFWWAWSDTCCINKAEKEVLDMSLRSMYSWYSYSALTIVHLKGVRGQLDVTLDGFLNILDQLLREFVGCRWNKRAWTLQEYFASRVIHFYTENWKPYLPIQKGPGNCQDSSPTNHKHSRAIQRGMELVTGLDAVRLATLKPGSGDIREKLRLASTREATRKEDIAYSLLGIFKLTLQAIYGDDEAPLALGRLLGALLTKSADVGILDWTGKPSEYNSCLPAEITVYQGSGSLHIPNPIIEETQVASVPVISPQDLDSVIKLHDRLLEASPPELLVGRLKLSCISFPLSFVSPDRSAGSYTANVGLLKRVKFSTEQDLSSAQNMFLVHPWFGCLLGPGIPLSDAERRDNALKLLSSLKQPFGALLLAWTPRGYERIATDQLITVQIREDVSAQQLLDNVRVLHIC